MLSVYIKKQKNNNFDIFFGYLTLVNVNALVVATTSWWLHFTAPVVALKVNKIYTYASLPRKKPKVVIIFLMLFHGNMTTAALRHADFTQFRQLH